jgi:hypothetical protein
VPHISLVFREMWDTTAFDLRTLEPNKHLPLRFAPLDLLPGKLR